MKLPKEKEKKKQQLCTVRKGRLAWNKKVALVKYADEFLLFVPSPSLSELTSQYSQKDLSCMIQRSSSSILCLLSVKRMSLFYFLFEWFSVSLVQMLQLQSSSVVAVVIYGPVSLCWSTNRWKSLEIICQSWFNRKLNVRVHHVLPHLVFSCLWCRISAQAGPVERRSHSHVRAILHVHDPTAPHSRSNMIRVKNVRLSGDKTFFGREMLVVACLQ